MLYHSRLLFTFLINPVLLRLYPQIFLKSQENEDWGDRVFDQLLKSKGGVVSVSEAYPHYLSSIWNSYKDLNIVYYPNLDAALKGLSSGDIDYLFEFKTLMIINSAQNKVSYEQVADFKIGFPLLVGFNKYTVSSQNMTEISGQFEIAFKTGREKALWEANLKSFLNIN